MTEDAAVMKAAVDAIKDYNPLLFCATKDNADDMGKLALEADCPLGVESRQR
jgi:CO dehydrogenase/acetyl-CoA synthase gamma subunit (corrinoid Fe-S protein)